MLISCAKKQVKSEDVIAGLYFTVDNSHVLQGPLNQTLKENTLVIRM